VRPTKRFREFLALFRTAWREELVKKLVGASFIVLVAGLALLWLPIQYRVRMLILEWSNISAKDAIDIARARLGPQVRDAKPFRNWSDPLQYIAVSLAPTAPPVDKGKVVILEGRSFR
jgi:hypothetical protein